jgi:hypothetical protein
MKNTILKTTLTLALTTVLANAECKIFTSPATDFSTLKGSETVALSISSIYYEKDKKGRKKMKIKLGKEALLDFDGKARTYIQDECKTNGWTKIYNFKIKSMGTKDWFDLYATYDYE